MRPSLENIELIDKYLRGELSGKAKTDFETALSDSAELRQQLELQKDFIRVANRIALKKEIASTQKKYKRSGFRKWGLLLFLFLSTLVILYLMLNSSSEKEEKTQPEKAIPTVNIAPQSDVTLTPSAGIQTTIAKSTISANNKTTHQKDNSASSKENVFYDFHGLKTWVQPDVQKFIINPAKGASIEGRYGTMIIVPTDAFTDEQGAIIKTAVTLELAEALNLDDMVLYRLGTLSNGKMLESGGMLHIRATQNDKEVNINPARPLYIEIPAVKTKPNMMVFEGDVHGGNVDWKNPTATKKYLINLPFGMLDFLPDGFSETVKGYMPYKNYRKPTKPLLDSLYYSLTNTVTVVKNREGAQVKKRTFWQYIFRNRQEQPLLGSLQFDTANVPQSGINPLTVKTIRNKEFNKTFIATKEFEERIKILHTCANGEELLQVYINNLDKDLCYSDSIIAGKVQGNEQRIFQFFANERLGNVKGSEMYQKQLAEFYAQKKQKYTDEKNKLNKKLGLDSKYTISEIQEKINAGDSTTLATLKNNLPAPNVTRSSYGFSWAKPGWVNIDAYLHLLDYGSQSVPIALLNPVGNTDVFQWLNTINNLTPLTIQEGEAVALFPLASAPEAEQMKNTFCFAVSRKGNSYQWFEKKYNPYTTESIVADLKDEKIETIRARLKSLGAEASVLQWMAAERANIKYLADKPKVPARKDDIYNLELDEKTIMLLQDIRMDIDLKTVSFKGYKKFIAEFSDNQIIVK
ncbi:MAG: hypothetical protein ACKOXB_06340 [Flavobacteriales bacterium]